MYPQAMRTTAAAAALTLLAGSAAAVDHLIPLNYNFNGMLHPGEGGDPDHPNGFRAIAERALRIGDGANPLGASAIVGASGLPYQIVTSAFTLDLVHLGNRAVAWAYDAAADGDNIGIQPTWDTNPDHRSTAQVTDVSALGIEVFGNTRIGVLYQISNGGGSFDITLTFTDASSVTVRLTGPDWFGAQNVPPPLPGVLSQSRLGGATWSATNSIDAGAPAPPTENLSVIEGVISIPDLIADGFGDHAGKTLASISFHNASFPFNNARGYAIIAATVRGSADFPPSGVGSVSPNPAVFGQPALFAVTVAPGSGAPNDITSVDLDLSAIDLGPLALNDAGADGDTEAGDGVWSVLVNVPTTVTGGPAASAFTITDAQARQGVGTIDYTIAAPPAAPDLGTLPPGATSFGGTLGPGQIKWVRFTLADGVDAAALEFLDIDTEGSTIGGAQFPDDTFIALYDGAGNRVAFDDDDGSGFLSQLSFGTGIPRPPAGDSAEYNGRDGAFLAAGTYYLGYSCFPASWGMTNWSASSTHTGSGAVTLNFRLGAESPVLAGPFHYSINGSDYYLLHRGFTFHEAGAHALALGGHLASIGGIGENEFCRAQVLGFDGTQRRGWIGLTDEASEGDFAWTDGSPLTFTQWGDGEPSNSNGAEHYVEMLGASGSWNDLVVTGAPGGGDWAIVEIPGVGPQFCEADWCRDGSVGVPDLFCFLSEWFAGAPEARCYGGPCGVSAIFAFLSIWFATGQGPCTP